MSAALSISREQKEAIGLLQVGTFLEYFDLMLYVHLAVLLNEIFFPKIDAQSAALLSAFAFCSSYVLRPFGALLFGYIGDHIGRKATVIITTLSMSTSCIIMANLPTYAQIGITASWMITICRIIQGISSMGEIVGAQIYITEITKPPYQYAAVSYVTVSSTLGGVVALAVATLVTRTGFDWRLAFWIGAGIAMVGSVARTRLRETPEFMEMEHKKSLAQEQADLADTRTLDQQKTERYTILAYFLVYCGGPISFYLAFMYFNPILKLHFNYSAEEIIFHNFLLSIIFCISNTFWALKSHTVHPLKIMRQRVQAMFLFTLFLPLLIYASTHPFHIFLIQSTALILSLGAIPAHSIFISHFPVFRRFTTTSMLYALSRATMYILSSFGMVYLTAYLSYWGLWLLILPITWGSLWSINYFNQLEYKLPLPITAPPLKKIRRKFS